MGFYKNIAKTKLDKDKYCKFCGSDSLKYLKILAYGEKGKEYHYRIACKQCEKSYYVGKTKYVYEQVKDKPWHKTESFRKMEILKLTNIS